MKWGLSPCRAKICYNACNAPVFTPDANGIVTKYTDNNAGLVTRLKRRDGNATRMSLDSAYDGAECLVREGSKRYTYGYLDKVLSVTDGDTTRTFTYHADGQLASASCDGIGRAGAPRTPQTESFLWDGLALIQRGDEQFMNEPHVGNAPQKLCFGGEPRAERRARRARKGPRGNPVASSKGTSYFNDALGTTVGCKQDGKYSPAVLTAFGERLDNVDSTSPAIRSLGEGWFTGKPFVEGLGHAFLMRNYRAGLAKWQTADPMGYPDGWNALAYCGNGVTSAVDLWGCETVLPDGGDTQWTGFGALSFGVMVRWNCNHEFDNPQFSSTINVLGATGENVIEYKSDREALLVFSKFVVNNSVAFLSGISTSFDHAWKLFVEIEVYVTIAYLDSGSNVRSDQFLNGRLSFSTVHWISKMWE